MKKLCMYLFGKLDTDARVKRSINALKNDFEITLICEESKDYNKINMEFYPEITSSLKRYISSIKILKKIIKLKKPAVVYCNDFYGIIPLLFIRFFVWKNKIVTIYDAHELIIDKNNKWMSKMWLLSKLEKRVLKFVDICICADEKRAEIMKKSYQIDKEIKIFRNISSLPKLYKEEYNGYLSKFDAQKIKILYAGAIASNRGLEKLVESVKKIKNIQLIFIGNGPIKEKIRKLCNDNLNDFLFIDAVPYEYLYQFVSHADIGYVSYENSSLNNIYSASNKVYEYISADVAILSNYNINTKKVIEKYRVGIATDNFEMGIKNIIKNLDFYKYNSKSIDIENLENKELVKLRTIILNVLNNVI